MSEVGTAINEVRVAVGDIAAEVLADLCDLVTDGMVDDGHSGQRPSETSVATNVPVEINEATPGSSQIYAGGQEYQATHQLKFGYSATTLAIQPEYRIKVQPRGLVGELVFEKAVPARSSKGPWLIYSAVLATGGRSPASV